MAKEPAHAIRHLDPYYYELEEFINTRCGQMGIAPPHEVNFQELEKKHGKDGEFAYSILTKLAFELDASIRTSLGKNIDNIEFTGTRLSRRSGF